jgi:flagellar biosynthesis/type III secretory pathway protein FliH
MSEGTPIRLHARPAVARVSSRSLDEISAQVAEGQVEAAYQRGLADGEAVMRATASGALEAAAERIDAARESAHEEIGAFAVKLGIAIAEQLLHAEIEAGRYDLEKIVRSTLAASEVGRGACVVHLAPEDVKRLKGVQLRSLTVLEDDPNMKPGDVHVTTPQGLLVRDLDSALDSIAERILGDMR